MAAMTARSWKSVVLMMLRFLLLLAVASLALGTDIQKEQSTDSSTHGVRRSSLQFMCYW
jgi:hypothetical protein